jgi:hypothetical protein
MCNRWWEKEEEAFIDQGDELSRVSSQRERKMDKLISPLWNKNDGTVKFGKI